MERCCKMKGFLTFLVLWIVKKNGGNGQDVAREIAKRKGEKPSPGTLYPVLKELTEKGMLTQADGGYAITKAGEKELHAACKEFHAIFYDVDEICGCEDQ